MRAVSVGSVQRGVVRATRGASTLEELVRGVHDVYASAFPIDLWCALAFDPATIAATGGYHDEGLPLARMPRLVEIEAGVDDVATFAALASAPEPVATLDRVTEGRRDVSVRYQDVLAPSGVGPELRVVFRDGGTTWGGMVLMRGTDLGDFHDDELAAVSSSVRDVAGALRRLLVQQAATSPETADGPGLLLLDGDGFEVREQTSAAARWLAEFEDGTTDDEVPYAVVALAATARVTGGAHRARLRTRSGRWLTLHAERLGDAASAVSVILQPSSPDEIARILAAAHGLTARELEVAELVARGLGNGEIAEALFVSRYTVQDHLKHVFEKLDVGSRAELTSRLYLSWDGNAAASIGR